MSRPRHAPARALAALLAGTCLSAVAAHAQDATWVGATGNWQDSANWSPATVPLGTATFGATGAPVIDFAAQPLTTIGTMVFGSGAQPYVFFLCGCEELRFTAGGIVNSSADAPTFNSAGRLVFTNASTAANAVINNDRFLEFFNQSTAGAAAITNLSGSGVVRFFDSANAGAATIVNDNGVVRFFNSSNAGTATITNNIAGAVDFRDASSASGATINNGDGATVNFRNTSTGGTATINNTIFGFVRFNDTSTAGNATINNSANNFFFGIADVRFTDSSTAGNATINNSGLGITEFRQNSTAGNATIENTHLGHVQFIGQATAGNATIINNGVAGTAFFNRSTAGNATIITNSGETVFFDRATGGNAQFITAAGADVDFSGTRGANNDGQITAGSIAGGGTYFIGGFNTLTVGSNNLSTEVSGVVADFNFCCGGPPGPGSLVKTGAGALTLSGMNTYTGSTTVNAGSLIVNGSIAHSSGLAVNSGALVGGTGFLPSTVINAGATLSPGNSVGTITANSLLFTPNSFYRVEILGSSADKTVVVGTATLAGTVQVSTLGSVQFGQPYTIVTSQTPNGRIGQFDGLTGVGNYLNATLSYTPTDALLTFLPSFSGASGLNINQNAVANALDRGFTLAGGTAGFEALFQLPPASLPYLLSQLSGEIRSAVAPAGFESMGQFLTLMLDPFAGTRGEAGNPQGPALGFAPEKQVAREAASAFAAYRAITKAPPWTAFEPRWTIWAAGYGGTSNARGDAVVGSQDRRANSGNLAAGADYRLSPDTVVGFAVAGGATNFSLDGGLGSGRGDIVQGGVYGATRFDDYYLAASLAAAYYDVSTDRTVSFAGATSRLTANFAASGFGARIEGGRRFVVAGSGVTPFAAMQAQTIHLPAVNEVAVSGPANVALAYGEQNASRLRSELGVKVDGQVGEWVGGSLFLFGRAAWAHQFWRDNPAIAALTILPGSGFTVQGAFTAADSALLSSGAELKFRNGLSLRGKLEAELAPTAAAYQASLTLRQIW
jgi:autotransporter-associated beta strand protein